MNNAILTVLLLSIPLFVCTICPLGWMRRRSVYLATGITLYVLTAGLILAALIAAGMAQGHGSTGSDGWDDMTPLVLWFAGGLLLLLVGFRIRPRHLQECDGEGASETLKTLREVGEDTKNVA